METIQVLEEILQLAKRGEVNTVLIFYDGPKTLGQRSYLGEPDAWSVQGRYIAQLEAFKARLVELYNQDD